MKKMFVVLVMAIFALSALAGCQNSADGQLNASSGRLVVDSSELTSSSTYENNHSYPICEITSDRITQTDKGKTFCVTGISLTVPADWKCLEQSSEDGTTYFFRDSKLNEKCELRFYFASAVYKYERTENEYLEWFSSADRENVKITSYTKEKLSGFEGTKVLSSYTKDNADYIQINFDNIVTGVRLYNFTATYPASDKDCEAAVESILGSIVITAI